ncbi:MAG: hypothetical protein MJ082_00725 [Clostridia bacterium]|nr:hypothetical protein [Clostridia bacterium]
MKHRIICLLLVVVMLASILLSAASCSKELANKIPGVDSDVPDTCKDGHHYVAEVIYEVTRMTDGVIRYTCTECGDSYLEIIPAERPIEETNSIFGLLSLCLPDANYSFNLKKGTEVDLGGTVALINKADFHYVVKEGAPYIIVDVDAMLTKADEESETPAAPEAFVGKFYLNRDDAYLYVSKGEEVLRNMHYDIDTFLASLLESSLDLKVSPVEILEQIKKLDEIARKANAVAKVLVDEEGNLTLLALGVLNLIKLPEVNTEDMIGITEDDGKTVYTLNAEGISKMLTVNGERTVASLLNDAYGAEDAADKLVAYVDALPGKTVGELVDVMVDFAEATGVPGDQLFAIVNAVASAVLERDFSIETLLLEAENAKICTLLKFNPVGEQTYEQWKTEVYDVKYKAKVTDALAMKVSDIYDLVSERFIEGALDYATIVDDAKTLDSMIKTLTVTVKDDKVIAAEIVTTRSSVVYDVETGSEISLVDVPEGMTEYEKLKVFIDTEGHFTLHEYNKILNGKEEQQVVDVLDAVYGENGLLTVTSYSTEEVADGATEVYPGTVLTVSKTEGVTLTGNKYAVVKEEETDAKNYAEAYTVKVTEDNFFFEGELPFPLPLDVDKATVKFGKDGYAFNYEVTSLLTGEPENYTPVDFSMTLDENGKISEFHFEMNEAPAVKAFYPEITGYGEGFDQEEKYEYFVPQTLFVDVKDGKINAVLSENIAYDDDGERENVQYRATPEDSFVALEVKQSAVTFNSVVVTTDEEGTVHVAVNAHDNGETYYFDEEKTCPKGWKYTVFENIYCADIKKDEIFVYAPDEFVVEGTAAVDKNEVGYVMDDDNYTATKTEVRNAWELTITPASVEFKHFSNDIEQPTSSKYAGKDEVNYLFDVAYEYYADIDVTVNFKDDVRNIVKTAKAAENANVFTVACEILKNADAHFVANQAYAQEETNLYKTNGFYTYEHIYWVGENTVAPLIDCEISSEKLVFALTDYNNSEKTIDKQHTYQYVADGETADSDFYAICEKYELCNYTSFEICKDGTLEFSYGSKTVANFYEETKATDEHGDEYVGIIHEAYLTYPLITVSRDKETHVITVKTNRFLCLRDSQETFRSDLYTVVSGGTLVYTPGESLKGSLDLVDVFGKTFRFFESDIEVENGKVNVAMLRVGTYSICVTFKYQPTEHGFELTASLYSDNYDEYKNKVYDPYDDEGDNMDLVADFNLDDHTVEVKLYQDYYGENRTLDVITFSWTKDENGGFVWKLSDYMLLESILFTNGGFDFDTVISGNQKAQNLTLTCVKGGNGTATYRLDLGLAVPYANDDGILLGYITEDQGITLDLVNNDEKFSFALGLEFGMFGNGDCEILAFTLDKVDGGNDYFNFNLDTIVAMVLAGNGYIVNRDGGFDFILSDSMLGDAVLRFDNVDGGVKIGLTFFGYEVIFDMKNLNGEFAADISVYALTEGESGYLLGAVSVATAGKHLDVNVSAMGMNEAIGCVLDLESKEPVPTKEDVFGEYDAFIEFGAKD